MTDFIYQNTHEDDAVLFETLCEKMLEKRLEHIDQKDHQIYRDRLKYEKEVITKMNFAGYMLTVWDFVKKAKELKIPTGTGRGSAPGSLAAFVLEITKVDPIKYNLLFERFLNPERVSMDIDIDVDICQARGGEIIDYLVSRYGREFNLIIDYVVSRDEHEFYLMGLDTLTTIDHALKLIAANGKTIDFDTMNMDDSGVFEMISAGKTEGVFYLESEELQELSRTLKPSCFEDLAAMIALYRPGPLEIGMLDDFIDRKNGRTEIAYILPELEPILAPTYGAIIYQEQVIQILHTFGGFSLGIADLVRRAMGKNRKSEMDKMRMEFAEGAISKGHNRHKAIELFALLDKFVGYGFNRSHAVAYAMIIYRTAYLKCHYPAEFMLANDALPPPRPCH
ncbi:hypothetical protein FACS1894103_5860 [Campylobacterota bacterium]|nr:hypothetical protein FACS1894103_5860 [Campylobacterota bacterium]